MYCWFKLFLLQLPLRACSVPGKLPPSSHAFPTPSPFPGGSQEKTLGWLSPGPEWWSALCTHRHFLGARLQTTNRSLILLTSLPRPYGGVKIPADKIKCCLGLGPTEIIMLFPQSHSLEWNVKKDVGLPAVGCQPAANCLWSERSSLLVVLQGSACVDISQFYTCTEFKCVHLQCLN